MTAKEYLEQCLNIEKLITENTRLLEYWRDRSTHISGSNFEPKYNASKSTSASFVFLEAQALGKPVEISCAIGDETVDGKPYSDIVEIARKYIHDLGGFEKFAEWGLIR